MEPITGALIGGAVSLIGGLFGGGKARKRARAAAKEKKRLEGKLTALKTVDKLSQTLIKILKTYHH